LGDYFKGGLQFPVKTRTAKEMEAGKSKKNNGTNTIAQEAQKQQDMHGGRKTIMEDSKTIGTNAEVQDSPEFKNGRKANETTNIEVDDNIVDDILNTQFTGSDESAAEDEPAQIGRAHV
jgi:hypothetical protein